MSNAIFPIALPGLMYDIKYAPKFNTLVHESASGNRTRLALMQYPLWQIEFAYDVLRSNFISSHYEQLLGFYMDRRGAFDSFLLAMPEHDACTAVQFGTGDGTVTQFQLKRSFNGSLEPCENINGAPSIYKAGVLQASGYSIGSTGIVTFTVAPAIGAALTWTGNYYHRCRFVEDSAEFNLFAYKLRELNSLRLEGSPINKV